MHWILKYSPIFFDLDGLLVNTEQLHFLAYQRMLAEYEVCLPWDFTSFAAVAHKSAEGLRKLITSHVPDLVEKQSWEGLYDKKKEIYMDLLQEGNLQLMPGAETILEMVWEHEIPHAVVTNSTQRQTELIRDKAPLLKKIPHWITREDYLNPKPAPDAYLRAMEVVGKSDKMLGFEDALRGIQALVGAGISPVLICSTKHPQLRELQKRDLRYFSSFCDLLSDKISN